MFEAVREFAQEFHYDMGVRFGRDESVFVVDATTQTLIPATIIGPDLRATRAKMSRLPLCYVTELLDHDLNPVGTRAVLFSQILPEFVLLDHLDFLLLKEAPVAVKNDAGQTVAWKDPRTGKFTKAPAGWKRPKPANKEKENVNMNGPIEIPIRRLDDDPDANTETFQFNYQVLDPDGMIERLRTHFDAGGFVAPDMAGEKRTPAKDRTMHELVRAARSALDELDEILYQMEHPTTPASDGTRVYPKNNEGNFVA